MLFRNFQPYGIFFSLNLGVSGLIKDTASQEYLKQNHEIGDILTLVVAESFDS